MKEVEMIMREWMRLQVWVESELEGLTYKGTRNGSVSIADRWGRGRGSGWCAGGGRRGLASARDI